MCSRRFGWIVVLALPLVCWAGHPGISQTHKHSFPTHTKPVDVGMVTLLAAPQRYEGKVVRTIGFMCIEFENDALYLHEEDYRHGLHKNSFALRLSESQRKEFKRLSLKYVLIEGTVHANGPEQTDLWSGAIGDITRLEVWRSDRANAQEKQALTPLMIAAKEGDFSSVQNLLRSGANVNAVDADGFSALQYASHSGGIRVVEALIAAGADVNARSVDGFTALHAAAHCGDIRVVRALLRAGAHVNARTKRNLTPLLYSIDMACGKPEITLALIRAGADVNRADSEGDTPLWLATTESSLAVMEALLKRGANPNAQSLSPGFKGDTPLHMAASNGLADQVKLLLKYGARTTIRNAQGQTPLDAVNKKWPEIRELLEQRSKARVNFNSPLQIRRKRTE